MKKTLFLCILLIGLLMTGALAAETLLYTDATGREVEIPAHIERVAVSGPMTQIIVLTLAPDRMVNISSEMSEEVAAYMPEYIPSLPALGQFYGKASNLNLEGLLVADPQVILDIGDLRESTREDMDGIQEQTGIPTIFIEAKFESFGDAYRELGGILGLEAEAEALATYCEATWADVAEKAATIPEEERLRVYYGLGENALTTAPSESVHSRLISAVGAANIIETQEGMGSSAEVSLEEILAGDPQVIILGAEGNPYDAIQEDAAWAQTTALKQGRVYEIPEGPYSWFSSPPSINRFLGLKWLGNLLYPEVYPYDMVQEAQDFYRLFYHYDLTQEEAEALMALSQGINER